jgi:biotin-dependent carboxylase-like uncharacterized protein
MIEILSNGALNTIQDLGRPGYRKMGITVAGAMDSVALWIGNLLVGNPPGSAGIEILIFPFRVRFLADAVIAVTGADCDALLDGAPLLPWWSTRVRQGQVLELQTPLQGSKGYLTLRGGVDVPLVLQSRSTDLKAKFGGHQGRALKKGDLLRLLPATGDWQTGYGVQRPQARLPSGGDSPPGVVQVRMIPAAEYAFFTTEGQERFRKQQWLVTPDSNRQGYRLSGTPLPTDGLPELLSHGLVPGTIQVPPSGQPIIQMSDANTSGGYPKMGVVIEADMWRLAQARPGDRLVFRVATVSEAVTALAKRRAWLQKLEQAICSRQRADGNVRRKNVDAGMARMGNIYA